MNSEAFDKGAYYVALEGVTRYGLAEAVRSILRGALGHAFFPSPPELRIQCDKAMGHHHDSLARAHHASKLRSQIVPERILPTPEEKARVSKIYEEFCKRHEERKNGPVEPLKLDPELVAQLPDNPSALVRQRMGVNVEARS